MLIKYLLFILFLLIGCQNNPIDSFINKSNQYRIDKEYSKAVIELKKAEKLHKENKKIDEVYFLLGEIFLNDIKDYSYAINEFKKIKKTSELYSNNLNEYTKAIKFYESFINDFTDHELYPSVQYELDQLSIYKNTIDSLNTIANSRKGE